MRRVVSLLLCAALFIACGSEDSTSQAGGLRPTATPTLSPTPTPTATFGECDQSCSPKPCLAMVNRTPRPGMCGSVAFEGEDASCLCLFPVTFCFGSCDPDTCAPSETLTHCDNGACYCVINPPPGTCVYDPNTGMQLFCVPTPTPTP